MRALWSSRQTVAPCGVVRASQWEYIGHNHDYPDDDSTFRRGRLSKTLNWQTLDKCFARAKPPVVVEAARSRSRVRPWQPTYWKTLPFGLRCTFRSTEHLPGRTLDSSRFRERWREWR